MEWWVDGCVGGWHGRVGGQVAFVRLLACVLACLHAPRCRRGGLASERRAASMRYRALVLVLVRVLLLLLLLFVRLGACCMLLAAAAGGAKKHCTAVTQFHLGASNNLTSTGGHGRIPPCSKRNASRTFAACGQQQPHQHGRARRDSAVLQEKRV